MIVYKNIWVKSFDTTDDMAKFFAHFSIPIDKDKCHLLFEKWSCWVRLPVSDPRLPALLHRCKSTDKHTLIIESIDYTDAELTSAELLLLRYTVTARGDAGPDLGNDYDYSQACSACLTGATLLPPFHFTPSDLPKRKEFAISHAEDVFVGGRLLKSLMLIPESSSWLAPMVDRRTGQTLDWAVLQAQVVLPRLHLATIGLKQEVSHHFSQCCSHCQRDSFSTTFEPAFQPAYARNDITNACAPLGGLAAIDVFASWERLGLGTRPNDPNPRRVAQPFLYFSQRLAKLFLELAPRDVQFTPVRLLND